MRTYIDYDNEKDAREAEIAFNGCIVERIEKSGRKVYRVYYYTD